MELTLIVRSQAELAAAVQALIEGIADGIEAAGASGTGPQVNPPDDIKVRGVLVTALNADNIEETDTTPANTQTTTEVQAANTQTTTETTSANTQTTTEVQAANTQTTTETASANTQTTTETTNAQTITATETQTSSESSRSIPAGRTTTRTEGGGNETITEMQHEDY